MKKVLCEINYVNGTRRQGFLKHCDNDIQINQELIDRITSLINNCDGRITLEFDDSSVAIILNNVNDIAFKLIDIEEE